MEIYSVKIYDISEEKLNKLCLLIDLEEKYKIERFINKKDEIRTVIEEILIRRIIIKNLKINSKCII